MDASQLFSFIDAGGFAEAFGKLYPRSAENAAARYKKAVRSFADIFPAHADLRVFSVPGRTEVGGNHTDHENGCVLAGSVDLDAIAVCAANKTDAVRVKSEGFEPDTVELNDLSPREQEKGTSAALIRGICARFIQLGYK
jgi:galactokinase